MRNATFKAQKSAQSSLAERRDQFLQQRQERTQARIQAKTQAKTPAKTPAGTQASLTLVIKREQPSSFSKISKTSTISISILPPSTPDAKLDVRIKATEIFEELLHSSQPGAGPAVGRISSRFEDFDAFLPLSSSPSPSSPSDLDLPEDIFDLIENLFLEPEPEPEPAAAPPVEPAFSVQPPAGAAPAQLQAPLQAPPPGQVPIAPQAPFVPFSIEPPGGPVIRHGVSSDDTRETAALGTLEYMWDE